MARKKTGTSDYEKSEGIAIDAGKASLAKAPWLFERRVAGSDRFFATLIENDSVHPDHYLIECNDGVGSKLILASLSGNYIPQSIDGVMMVINDLATVINGRPNSLNIYISTQEKVRKKFMGQIMEGVRIGMEQAKSRFAEFDLNIGKIETASLEKFVSTGVPGLGYDLAFSLTGFIRKSKVPRLNPESGDKIIGVASSGLNSNGFTMACEAVFSPDVEYREEWKPCYSGRHMLDDKPEVLQGKSVLEALQAPTPCYFPIAAEIGTLSPRNIYGVNITGNGLANFNRVGRNVSFEITDPLPLLPVHEFVIQEAKLTPRAAYEKLNMGMGFSFIVPRHLAEFIREGINSKEEQRAEIVGEVYKTKSKVLRTTIHKPYEGDALTYRGYSA